jgi:hypothetical protein
MADENGVKRDATNDHPGIREAGEERDSCRYGM